MSVLVDTIKSTVRGNIVDRTETGVSPYFSDAELLIAINLTKDEFFSFRPEAFYTDTVLYAPPADLTAESTSLVINAWAVHQFCYGVAYHLLSQRGKDSYYRKAAQEVFKKYQG